MLRNVLDWFGFGDGPGAHADGHRHGHGHHDGAGYGHSHGVIDPTIATTERGICAVKWSFLILAVTALLQLGVVAVTGSVALLADTIHNVADAATAIPLWIAFVLARRKPNARFTYGYGRVEDLAGAAIVLIIVSSALVAGYQAIQRLLDPQPIHLLWAVAAAGVIGFMGNEAVAVLRIRVGREINSAALVADGYHARTDGWTSLAVVVGALGVWLGFPLADPIVGLIITVMILGIVWQSSIAVFTRMLDGIEPGTIANIRHAAGHVTGAHVTDVRARWIGHRLYADLDVMIPATATLSEADAVRVALSKALASHIPAVAEARIVIRSSQKAGALADLLPASTTPAQRADDHLDEHVHDQGHQHAHKARKT